MQNNTVKTRKINP